MLPEVSTRTVRFKPEHWLRGFQAIIGSGTVVWTNEQYEYRIPPTTVMLLVEKRIPFEMVE